MRWWLELVIGVLAFVGLWVTVDKAAAGILRAWARARRDRVTPLLEDEAYCYPECPEGCDCSRMELQAEADEEMGYFDELPEERSAADLGFGAERERRAEPWEAFQRIQYEAMGFEFPSGLMARVRELTP